MKTNDGERNGQNVPTQIDIFIFQKDVKPVHDKPKVYSLHVKTDIKYRYAITLITSRVVNPANVSQEVKFHVVLPETAFISGFVMTINEKDYPAYVKEKEEAQKDYNLAVSQGLAAAHIAHSARDSNEFDVAVNIEPLNKVSFELIYEEFLERKLSAYKNEINISPGQVDEGYFVHFYSDDTLKPLNKHVVFVLDLSGSMHGRKLQQVKDAMNQILSDLKPKDYFSLVLFSDSSKVLQISE
ncbi:hypothetical protein AAG570_000255 [Ranatra chinensis]|uniref:Uncharacterized protein n=1 Tax=Ranatra chinensis TaxID=642074 RepID=A0ABD0ZDG1_9HEMI